MTTERALSIQRERATNDLLAAATGLAKVLGIPTPVLPTHKHAAVMEVRRLETLAAFLEQVAGAVKLQQYPADLGANTPAGAVGSVTTETVRTAPVGRGRK